MSIKPPYYPIIYIRGFAATRTEIEDTVATPYMGFNLGSTKIRQNYKNDIVRFVFESALLRLIKDEKYQDTFIDGDLIPADERVSSKTIWIFRYYEQVSEDIGGGERPTIPQFAVDLRKFILRIRDQVCGTNKAERKKFKVYLIAHSMGGLIARCYLQNICPNGAKAATRTAAAAKQLNSALGLPGDSLVDKVFTYATPHNGIEIGGVNVPDLGNLDPVHARNFNRDYIRTYLSLPKKSERVDSLNGKFPVERFFSFVGTNYRDYAAFFNLAKRGTGPMSDGLVMMRNATVGRSPRAFAHRSHSGHYGIVNSEEGYQNLRRFLFGDVRVDVMLIADEITLPDVVENKIGKKRERVKAAYNIEVAAKVRGAKYFLNERKVAQESAIRRTYEKLVHDRKPIYLFSGYLLKTARPEDSTKARDPLAFAVQVSIEVPLYEIDNQFWFDHHFEGGHILDETITFHVVFVGNKATIKYGLASRLGPGVAEETLSQRDGGKGISKYDLALGFPADTKPDKKPKPGFRGRLALNVSKWNA